MLGSLSPRRPFYAARQKHHKLRPVIRCIRQHISDVCPKEREDIVIIGAGVAGLSTAHFLLSKSSADTSAELPLSSKVRVIDTFPCVAGGTSRKNGGLLCPSLSSAWSAFPLFKGKNAIVPQLISFGRTETSPITFDPKLLLDSRLWNFGLHWALQRARSHQQNNHIGAIMKYSMQCFNDQEDAIVQSISFNRVAQGTKTKDGNLAPEDSSGDIGLFCKGLAQELNNAHGERIAYGLGETVVGLQVKEGTATAVKIKRSDGTEMLHKADKFVIAAGIGSYDTCKQFGVQCPVFPVKGYIISFRSDIRVTHNIELPNKAFVSPLGDGEYRLSGFAEFTSDYRDGAHAMDLNMHRVNSLVDVAKEAFPDLTVFDVDCGYRPLSPDDAPIIGLTSRVSNVYLCTGHGSKGWTMGLGSGKLLADLILSNSPEINPLPYQPSRFDLIF